MAEEVDAGGGQKQLRPTKRKQKVEPKNEFSPGAVFDVKANEEVELDAEASRYVAVKGEGGDRRA